MERLIDFFEDAPELFWVIDEHYNLVYANRAFTIATAKEYHKPIKKGENVLKVETEGSNNYNFWKGCYDKALNAGKLNVTINGEDIGKSDRLQIDLKVYDSFSKYVCTRMYPLVTTDSTYSNNLAPSVENHILRLSLNKTGKIVEVDEGIAKQLGYHSSWMLQQAITNFLHPDELSILQSNFRANKDMSATWVRIKNSHQEYYWCHIELYTKLPSSKKNVTHEIVVKSILAKDTDEYSFVPDSNLLQVITEAQAYYINRRSVKKALDVCLDFFKQEGIAHYALIGAIEWQNQQPKIKVVSEKGTWLSTQTELINKYITSLETLCAEIQIAVNKTKNGVKDYYQKTFDNSYHTIFPLISNKELHGVLSVSNLSFALNTEAFIPYLSYFKPLFVSILQSERFIKKANQSVYAVSESRDELQTLIASLDDTILEINPELFIVKVWSTLNKNGLFGKKLISGINISDVFESSLYATLSIELKKVFNDEPYKLIEFLDDQQVPNKWFAAKMNLIRLFNGEKRISLLLQDITYQKEANLAMQEALKKEVDLNDLKSRMITSVSHEFRTPLATIISSTELIEMHLKREEQTALLDKLEEFFTNIHEEVERLTDMMHNFLVMGRFEEMKTPFLPRKIDVHGLVKRIIRSSFQLKYGEEKILIKTLNIPQEVELDPSLFWHILSNLVSNAIKYSNAAAVVLVELDFSPTTFTLRVIDKGIGIPEADIPKVFDTFFRATNSENQSGYGLGLSIVEKFATLHKATVALTSKVNEGSTFSVTFQYKIQ